MLKFINSLATIEVNKALEAIQVTFRGSAGTIHQYLETLRMATSFANLHSLNKYLLVKDGFDDVSCQQFCSLMEDWLYLVNANFNQLSLRKVKVALLANQDSYKQLSEHISPKYYLYELFAFFSDEEKAFSYLQANPVNKVHQSI